ncbi:phosphatidylinositol-glycan-specific phospholipase D-like isoform X2 [Watersipora subatra]
MNFPPPWSEETEKLVVFMLGFVSHQVADITWHSLGIRQGFIRTMAAVDFHGVYDTSHSAADFGGDVVNAYRGDYSYVHATQWYVPVDHLNKIYQLYYKRLLLPVEVIEECTALIYLAILGEKLALAEVYAETAVKSPFLTQNLDSFFLGGMYDMALWSTSIWDNVIYLLEHGFSENCTTPENPLYIRCLRGEVTTLPPSIKGAHRVTVPEYRYSLGKEALLTKRTPYGLLLWPVGNVTERLYKREKKTPVKTNESKQKLPGTVISIRKPYSRLGQVVLLADVNGDALDDLIISAPMYSSANHTDYEGQVFVIYGKSDGFPKGDFSVEDLANVTLTGHHNTARRFGSGVAVLDMNLDGFQDIVVSSPNYNWENLKYTGALAVWYGNSSGSFAESPSIISVDWDAPLYQNEGVHLFSEDVDRDGHDDLIISSPYSPGPAGPQSGKLCFVKSNKQFNFTIWKCIYGPGAGSNTSWFGSSVITAEDPKMGPVLIVAAPLFRLCYHKSCKFSPNDTQAAGQVTIWSLPDLKLIRMLNGSEEHQHFGSSLTVGQPFGRNDSAVLAIGMDSVDVNGSILGYNETLRQVGAVAMWNLSSLADHNAFTSSYLYGDRRFSMFGSQSKFADLDGDGKDELLVGAPHFTQDPTELLYGAEKGRIYVFGNGAAFPTEDVSKAACEGELMTPCAAKQSSMLLGWTEEKAHFGGRLAMSTPAARGGIQLAVTALRSSHGARHSGSVFIYQADDLARG